MLIGLSKVKDVKPIVPFSRNIQSVVYGDFIDYRTGSIHNGTEYWLSLSDVLLDYIEHPEAKFEGKAGLLSRRNVYADSRLYIGKEANKIKNNLSGLDASRVNVYNRDAIAMENIGSMTLKYALDIGLPKRTFYRLKKNVNCDKVAKLREKTQIRLIKNSI